MNEVLFRTKYIENQCVWEFSVDKVTYYISNDVFNEMVSIFKKAKDKVVYSLVDVSGLETTIKISGKVTIARAREYLELCQESYKESFG